MKPSTRFSVAVHALVFLAHFKDRYMPSRWVARSVNTNAVVIRRLLRSLVSAGIVKAIDARGGGYTLAKPPGDIDLLTVYRAVEEERIVATHSPSRACPIGKQVPGVLRKALEPSEKAFRAALSQQNLAQVSAEMEAAWFAEAPRRFPEPRSVIVYTTTQVMAGVLPIVYVIHDDEDRWSFLCATTPFSQRSFRERRYESLASVLSTDPTIEELADLPLGWQAWRAKPTHEWVRRLKWKE